MSAGRVEHIYIPLDSFVYILGVCGTHMYPQTLLYISSVYVGHTYIYPQAPLYMSYVYVGHTHIPADSSVYILCVNWTHTYTRKLLCICGFSWGFSLYVSESPPNIHMCIYV